MEDEFLVSYEAVTPGIPVLTRDKEQFGILEHVLEVPQLDLFDGIVVWVGGALATGTSGSRKATGTAGLRHSGGLRFVDADKIAAITAGYIRCDLDHSEVGLLSPPDGAPVYHVNMMGETGPALHDRIGRMFRRPHWTRE